MRPFSYILMSIAASLLLTSFAPSSLAQQTKKNDSTKDLQTWKPDPKRLSFLELDYSSENWSLRPPKPAQKRLTGSTGESRTTFGIADKDGLTGVLIVTEVTAPIKEGVSAEDAHAKMVGLLKSRSQNFRETATETGLIEGKRFIRTRFSAEALPGIKGTGYGFVYSTLEGKRPMALTGIGVGSAIEIFEAAALTIKLK